MKRTLSVLVVGLFACTSGPPPVASGESALTDAQCDYFAVDGKVQICHATGSAKNPYKILKVSEAACVNGHADHEDDYVAVNDPTCQGLGCLPDDAPCDETLPCCDGSSCQEGTCQPDGPSDGCPGGSVAHSTSDDGLTGTFIFDQFVASTGPGVAASDSWKQCQVEVDVPVGENVVWHFTADYRGYVQLPAGLRASREASYSYDAVTGAVTQFVGPVAKDYLARDGFCGIGPATITITSEVRLDRSATGSGQITTDSIDTKVTTDFSNPDEDEYGDEDEDFPVCP